MLYFRIRFLLIGLFLAVGCALFYLMGIWAAIPSFTAALVLIISFFILGTVGPAFTKLKRGKLQEADHLINLTYFPNLLLRRHRSYYHFVKGMLALQKKELEIGASNFNSALELGLRNDNDKSFASLNLAHIHYVQGNHEQSKKYLIECKKYNFKDLMLSEKIEELEKALKLH